MLILNLKNYEEARGEKLESILNIIDKVIEQSASAQSKMFVAVPMPFLAYAKFKYPDISLIAQHVDFQNSFNSTGWTTSDTLKSINVNISIYNHAEHRVYDDKILDNIKSIQDSGIKLIVACESLEEARRLLEVQPYAIAFEDKNLIGSGQSITNHKPEDIRKFIQLCTGKTKMIIGAGISSQSDIQTGLELGAEGFIVASAFVKAENPEQKLEELIQPLL